MYETIKTMALQRRLKGTVDKLQRVDPDSDLVLEYRAMNARILKRIRLFRAHAEVALCLARTKAERKAAAEYVHLVILAESEFATGVERAN
jgi:hypothetical protein